MSVVCLSVTYLTLSREWKGITSWKFAGKTGSHDIGDREPIYKSKGQRSR